MHASCYINVYIYFDTEVRGLVNKKHVQEGHEQVQRALMDYTINCYPSLPVLRNSTLCILLTEVDRRIYRGINYFFYMWSLQEKFNKLLAVLPEIHVVASRGEDHLYHKHCNGGAPTQTLLMEMLHAKRKWNNRFLLVTFAIE